MILSREKSNRMFHTKATKNNKIQQQKTLTIDKWHQMLITGLSVLIFRGGRHGGHEKNREGPEHGNQ
jgi:hypothetical protein